MNPLLEIKNLKIIHRKYKKTLIDNINFGLNDSEILGIIGESGSGKTLTCRSVLNLLDRKAFDVSGEILFENQNLLSVSDSPNLVKFSSILAIRCFFEAFWCNFNVSSICLPILLMGSKALIGFCIINAIFFPLTAFNDLSK